MRQHATTDEDGATEVTEFTESLASFVFSVPSVAVFREV